MLIGSRSLVVFIIVSFGDKVPRNTQHATLCHSNIFLNITRHTRGSFWNIFLPWRLFLGLHAYVDYAADETAFRAVCCYSPNAKLPHPMYLVYVNIWH